MLWLADGRAPRTDTLIQRLAPHYDKMTAFEKLSFDANLALYESKTLRKNRWKEYAQIREKQYQMFPTDYVISSFYSFHLGTRENKPSKAWEVNSQIDLESFPEELHSTRINRAIYRSIYGLNAGKYDEVLKLLNAYLKPEKRGDYQGIYYTMKSLALSRNGQIDSLHRILDEVKQLKDASSWHKPEYDEVTFCNEVANELLLKNEQEEANKFLNLALAWAFEDPQE